MSLGKANKVFNQAVEEGYINYGVEYSVTDKGRQLLNNHKVDNAVIMAAGFGSRFVPMTYDTPKGLLEVHGEVMIERQIKQLQEVGIEEIVIVVGYLREKFEYLTDKFGVKLVYNPDFNEKNNISSIKYAAKYLKNSYLLTSDIYMPENLYRNYEYNSFYAVEYFESYTEEWKVEFDQTGLINDVDPQGGEKCWAMNGPAFFTKDFSTILVDEVEKIYDKKYASQWYWEDVYMRNLDKFDLYIKKYPVGTILEFESLEELRVFDKSYLEESRSLILDVIKEVFHVELKDIVNIQTLKVGMTNDSFLFEVKGVRYVFRNPGVGTDQLIKRSEEADVYNAINHLNIADNILYIEPKYGYKISEYIEDSSMMDKNDPHQYNEALNIIRKLHNSGLVVSHEFDLEERINFYYELCKENKAVLFSDFKEVQELINELIIKVKSQNYPKVLCHIDFVSVNFLKHDKGLTLLDWEYSGMADPLTDLAMYVVYEGLQDDEIIVLLSDYLEREPDKEEIWRLHSYIALAGFLWSMWTQYKQSVGSDFGTYAMEQYNYGRKYSRIALESVPNEE